MQGVRQSGSLFPSAHSELVLLSWSLWRCKQVCPKLVDPATWLGGSERCICWAISVIVKRKLEPLWSGLPKQPQRRGQGGRICRLLDLKAENNPGVTSESENRPAEAVEAYNLALDWQNASKNPSAQPFLNLGSLLISQQRANDAVPLLERAVGIAPSDAKTHEQLSRALEGAGDQQSAISEMELAIKLDSQNPRLHFEVGQMYRRAGRLDDSRKELERSSSLYGTHSTPTEH